ncbi:hypothetical protein [Kitasatospora sp. NPDC094016]|uniref:hypothetical protein n=1 Tax=Kitasatospora sp. NPDC094016 TaxID=3154986 RepID=UPI0033340D0F
MVDRTRPGQFVRRHFEAMVFTYLAEELRTGDVAVAGSKEYGDWSKQLLAWEIVEEKLPAYLVEIGLAEDEGEAAENRAAKGDRSLLDHLPWFRVTPPSPPALISWHLFPGRPRDGAPSFPGRHLQDPDGTTAPLVETGEQTG